MSKQKHSPNPNNKRCWRCICGAFNVPGAPECKIILMEQSSSRTKILESYKRDLDNLKLSQSKAARQRFELSSLAESLAAKVKPKGE